MTKQYTKNEANNNLYLKNEIKISAYWLTHETLPVICKEVPGKGYRHFLTKKTLIQFIYLLPEWNMLSKGLTHIILSRGADGADGWYTDNILGINAWERDLWRRVPPDYYAEHKIILDRLNVECCKQGREYLCKFEIESIKAFQLLHIFLHELGHHYDKITTKSQKESSRGEGYAESYAHKYEDMIWNRYFSIIEK